VDNLESEHQDGSDVWAISGYLSVPLTIVAICAVILVMGGIAQDSGPRNDFLLYRVAWPAFGLSLILSGLGLFLSRSRIAGTISAVVFIPLLLIFVLQIASKLNLF